jgi:cohesin loading factor subunit SCC2
LGVRKRVIKLLKGIYPVISDHDARVEICKRLVGRVNDEDDGVKDLAASAVEELWFSAKLVIKQKGDEVVERETSPAEKRETASKAAILMAVAGSFRERPTPLEETVRLVSEKCQHWPPNNR